MNMNLRLRETLESLKDRARRAFFAESQIEVLIPFQIKAMRKRRGWTQKELADHAGMAQARISVLENVNNEGAVNVRTLLKIAEAFDVGLIVRFAPFSELAEWSTRMQRSNHEVPTFDDELAASVCDEEDQDACISPADLAKRQFNLHDINDSRAA